MHKLFSYQVVKAAIISGHFLKLKKHYYEHPDYKS